MWAIQPKTPDVTLTRVWGTSSNDVWALGRFLAAYSTLQHWNGTSWSTKNPGIYTLEAIWGTSATSMWVVGARGAILRYVP